MITQVYNFRHSPLDLLNIFKDEPYCFLLESSLVDKKYGRYSILGFDPFHVHQQKNKGDLNQLKKDFYRYHQPETASSLPLKSGLVGFIGYDYGLHQEKIAHHSIDDLNLPDCVFGFYDCILTIDHLKNKLYITSSGWPERDAHLKQTRAKDRLKAIIKKLSVLNDSIDFDYHQSFELQEKYLTSNFTKEEYCGAVKRALNYIKEGEIYQVNLSQRFCFNSEYVLNPLSIYQTLRRLSASSFGGYFDANDFQVISSSPERFLHLRDRRVHTRPMKGTRPRGITEEDDIRYRREMITSKKEKAELLMITDLERNDLGRVCEYGSVRVSDMRSIEAYQTVYQATATVEGRLQKQRDAFDLIENCFPGGSITGCPKIRSMEIIEELEPTRRGIYTGSLGYIDFNGNMDFNILIRTLLSKDRNVYFQVGGGIVADSTPEAEFEETLIKAKAMKSALYQMNVKQPQTLATPLS